MHINILLLIIVLTNIITSFSECSLSSIHKDNIFRITILTKNSSTIIQAEQGLEWQKSKERFIARGNVRLKHANFMINTNLLIVYYRKVNVGNKIYRLKAVGNTKITFPMGIFSGEKADYDIYRRVLYIIGNPIHLETATETLTARKDVEYREQQRVAVARGDVHIVTQDGGILRTDMANIDFRDDTLFTTKKYIIDGNLLFKIYRKILCGERGIYDVHSGVFLMIGRNVQFY